MRLNLLICVTLMATLALGCASDPTATNSNSGVLSACGQTSDEQTESGEQKKPLSRESIPAVALLVRGGMTESEVKAILGDQCHLVVGSGCTRYSYCLGESESLTIALTHSGRSARVSAAYYYDSVTEREVDILRNE